MIKRILIANRGEIAVRIIKTANRLGIETIAVYTPNELNALHVKKATFKALLKGDSLQDSYLDITQIVAIAQQFNADAIHPGYGFLSENAAFAKACSAAHIKFIGPSAQAIELMGNKTKANLTAQQNGLPLLKKISVINKKANGDIKSLQLPVIIKAAMGGGGKGMRIVSDFDKIDDEIKSAGDEALRYFGDDTVYIEEYIENPRHIEIQILGDSFGNAIHLFERECSIQRRHQKIIEEAPALNLPKSVKEKMYADAIKIAQNIGYESAGTIEFLLTPDNKHYFLEMNTRIQVEHPVTEEVTGVDIIEEQIKIAEGKHLSFTQDDIQLCNHAIEARIYAENPAMNFAPAFGTILHAHIPHHTHIRIDGGAQTNDNLNPNFDPLLKKVISVAKNREDSIQYLNHFLKEYALFGVDTNREYLINITEDEDFQSGNYSTAFCKNKSNKLLASTTSDPEENEILSSAYWVLKTRNQENQDSIWKSIGYWRQQNLKEILIDDTSFSTELTDKSLYALTVKNTDRETSISSINIEENQLSFIFNHKFVKLNYFISSNDVFYVQYNGVKHIIVDKLKSGKKDRPEELSNITRLKAPMPGKIIDIKINKGDFVKAGETLMVLEAMKTENSLIAWKDTMITEINIEQGQQVQLEQLLLTTE